MLAIAEFRRLVDGTSDEVAQANDLRRIYEIVGLPAGPGLKRSEASDHLTAEIQRRLPHDLRPVWLWVHQLQQGLIVEHVVSGAALEPYLSVATALRGAAHAARSGNAHSEEPAWPEIVQLCRQSAELNSGVYAVGGNDLVTHHPRAMAVAQAALRLRERGYQCDVQNGIAVVPEPERRKIVAAMEEQISALGEVNVAAEIFRCLTPRWNGAMHRHLLGQRVNALGTGVRPEMPFGHLLQLAAKQLRRTPVPDTFNREGWRRLIDLATDFAANYDVQPYSTWELEGVNAVSLDGFVTELALCDRFFGLRQFRPTDVGDAVRGLFDWVSEDQESQLGWSVVAAADVADALLRQIAPDAGPSIFGAREIEQHCAAVPPEQVERVIGCLTHAARPNRQFVLPESSSEATFSAKPLVRLDDGRLILLDASSCAPSCFEALAGALYHIDRNAFSHIGLAVERFLLRRMTEHSMEVVQGVYEHPEGVGECDAVIETSDCILLAELKIKSLTRAAQGGGDLAILVDLGASLFDAAAQCNRHELVLRKRGSLTLRQEDGSERVIEHRHRRIEKLALTFDDFGSFQDRTVLFQLFASCIGSRFEAIDQSLQPKLENLNKKAKVLAEQFRELADLDQRLEQRPFFPFWFLSFGQVLVLLDPVVSNASFKEQLWLTRHVATHTLDFYTDLASMRQFRAGTTNR